MVRIITTSEAKAHASKLRDILDNHGHQLKHTETLEVISKLEGAPDWNTYTAHLKKLERNPGGRNAAFSASASDQPNTPDEDKLLYCSFCDRSQHEVHKLIAGPNIFICERCTDLCITIIQEEMVEASEDRGDFKNMPALSALIREAQSKDNQSESSD